MLVPTTLHKKKVLNPPYSRRARGRCFSVPKSRNVVILLACCLLSCLCLLVWLSACLYLDDEMTLLYFPSFPLLPLLYCTSSTVDYSQPSLLCCCAVHSPLVIATRNATSTRRQGHRRHTRRRGRCAWQVTMTMGVTVTIHEEEDDAQVSRLQNTNTAD